MKKYKSLSLSVLAISFEVMTKANTAPEGQPEKIEDVKGTRDVALSYGTVAELPPDNPLVKDLVSKGHLEEVKEVAEPKKPAK